MSPVPALPSASVASAELVAAVAAWYEADARDLPWRHDGVGAWAVLVSEVMLQQTPVSRVLPAWQHWLQRWPTPTALAADPPGEAVRMWGRLGYPRRALRLHACATALVERFDGAVPDDVAELESLPGVGTYTARAVAVFAHGRRHPVVDTNVRRVVARAVEGKAQARAASTARDHALVESLLPAGATAAGRVSIALMELGALVCTARAPRCGSCPLLDRCAWQRLGAPADDVPARRTQTWAGSDRQVRGLLLRCVREADEPVPSDRLDGQWQDPVQRERALRGLLDDGLLEARPDGRYALPA